MHAAHFVHGVVGTRSWDRCAVHVIHGVMQEMTMEQPLARAIRGEFQHSDFSAADIDRVRGDMLMGREEPGSPISDSKAVAMQVDRMGHHT